MEAVSLYPSPKLVRYFLALHVRLIVTVDFAKEGPPMGHGL